MRGRESGKERERESAREKEKKEEKGKKENRGENGESDTKRFLLSTPAPPNASPSTVPLMGMAREQHNSHKGETREKHNSYKWKTITTERQLTISRQTSCNDD